MNKLLALTIFIPLFTVGQNTKYNETVNKLTDYFSKVHGQDSIKYQKLFFATFPDNFIDLNAVYGFNSKIHDNVYHGAPLYDGYEHISFLFDLTTIPEKEFYQKILNIAIGGHWNADAVNYFQDGLHRKVLQNPKLAFDLLKVKNDSEIKSIFFFFFHGIHPPYENIPVELQAMKTYDSRIYKILKQGFIEAISKSGHEYFIDK